MRTLTRSALVACPPAEVFALVNDVGSYPQFVPGCAAAEVLLATDERGRRAAAGAARTPEHGADDPQPPFPHSEIRLELVAGPLRTLEGAWKFSPVGSNGCRIELELRFEFSNPLKAALLDPLIEGSGLVHGPGLRGPGAACPAHAGLTARHKRCLVAVDGPRGPLLCELLLAAEATIAVALAEARRRLEPDPQAGAITGDRLGGSDVGVWGVRCGREVVPRDGDRIELYRPLPDDPRQRRRQRVRKGAVVRWRVRARVPTSPVRQAPV